MYPFGVGVAKRTVPFEVLPAALTDLLALFDARGVPDSVLAVQLLMVEGNNTLLPPSHDNGLSVNILLTLQGRPPVVGQLGQATTAAITLACVSLVLVVAFYVRLHHKARKRQKREEIFSSDAAVGVGVSKGWPVLSKLKSSSSRKVLAPPISSPSGQGTARTDGAGSRSSAVGGTEATLASAGNLADSVDGTGSAAGVMSPLPPPDTLSAHGDTPRPKRAAATPGAGGGSTSRSTPGVVGTARTGTVASGTSPTTPKHRGSPREPGVRSPASTGAEAKASVGASYLRSYDSPLPSSVHSSPFSTSGVVLSPTGASLFSTDHMLAQNSRVRQLRQGGRVDSP